MNDGDAVWYRQTCRGGYGFQRDVPGVFVKRTDRRVIVRLLLKSGESTDVTVHPKNVRPRDPEAVRR